MLIHIRKRYLRVQNIVRFKIYPSISRIFDKHVYTVRSGIVKGLKKRGGIGFIPGIYKLSKEDEFFQNLNLYGLTVYDVGAFVGIYTMFFAISVGAGGKVVAFEPNPILYKNIKENLYLNRLYNVDVKNIALGKEKKIATLGFPRSIPGVGSIQKNERSRILKLKDAISMDVNVDTIDNLIKTLKIPKPNFIKIDVQGLEFDILLGMKKTINKCKPNIYVEIHSIPYIDWKFYNLFNVVDFFIKNKYTIYHVESRTFINYDNYNIVKEDTHLYCVPI